MGEENNFYLAPWVEEYKEKEKARQTWLQQQAEKYAQSVEDSKHPNGHYMNELVVTPQGTSLGTVSSDAMLDNLVSTQRESAAKERKQSREMIQHIHEGTGEAAKWLTPLVMAPAFITTGGPIMQMLARPLTTTARVASTVFPRAARALPYTQMADRGIMGYLGTTGMYNTGKKWHEGKISWYQSIPQMGLEGLMVADAAPLVKTAGKAAIKGADYTARRMYAPYDFYRIIQETTPKLEPLSPITRTIIGSSSLKDKALSYDQFGNIIVNPNFYFRRGWGIIDDAVKTGRIRVPEGDYKTEALKKYPWLDNGNSFSTALLNHSFPYFSEGELWNSMAKFGKEPEDLIAIPNDISGVKWVAGSKFGTLHPEAVPNQFGGRGTPTIDGQVNIFPTEKAILYKLNPKTNRYEIYTQPAIKNSTLSWEEALQILPKQQTIEISPEELYKFFQNQKDYYFMGHGTARTNVTPETIFESGLRIKNGEISNTTSPISEANLANWPHLNSEEIIILPGKASSFKYDSVYGHIPSDWYSSDVFHWTDNPEVVGHGPFAVRKPNATFTETTRNGIPGVFTKPEAILGSYNTRTHILKLNPNSQYQFSFDTAPKVDKRLSAIQNATPEGVAESFESRLPYATSANKPLLRAIPGNPENNRELVEMELKKLREQYPNASEKELEKLFEQTQGQSIEDVLNARGFVAKDDITGEAYAARYDNTVSPIHSILTKTHEENHTMFNLNPNFFKHPTVTPLKNPSGYLKNYLNEEAGFKLPDLSLTNPSFEEAEYLEADEISSFMSMFKSLLGKMKNEQVTERDIEWFIQNYRIIGQRTNHMKEYKYIAEHITDPKKFAEWVTQFSNVLLPPVIGGSSLLYLSNSQKYKQGGKIDLLKFLQ